MSIQMEAIIPAISSINDKGFFSLLFVLFVLSSTDLILLLFKLCRVSTFKLFNSNQEFVF